MVSGKADRGFLTVPLLELMAARTCRARLGARARTQSSLQRPVANYLGNPQDDGSTAKHARLEEAGACTKAGRVSVLKWNPPSNYIHTRAPEKRSWSCSSGIGTPAHVSFPSRLERAHCH